ncbi:MAG: hypothetical protein ABIU95_02820, partial [Burkholderiales bacterium]
MSPHGTPMRLWLGRAACGCALGAAIALLEFAYYAPLASTASARSIESLLSSLAVWCGESALFALILTTVEWWRRPNALRGWSLTLAVTAGVIVAVLAWHAIAEFVLRDTLGMRPFRDYVGQPGVWIGAVLYHTWLLLVFGGLGCAAYVSQRRHAQMVAALRAAELARATSQRRLAEMSLAAMQARIDPDFVMATLTRLEHLYDGDPQSADRALDELIVFLRGALADLRV